MSADFCSLSKVKNVNVVYDECGTLVGRYINIRDNQELLDSFCNSWLKTYKSNPNFYLTLDLETSGLMPIKEHILLFSITWDGKQALVFSPQDVDMTKMVEVLETIPLNNHNLKFDMKFIKQHYGVMPKIFFDTMIGSQIGWPGVFQKINKSAPFGLGTVAKNLLSGLKMEKETRNEFIGMPLGTHMTQQQVDYAAKDSLITHRLTPLIVNRLLQEDTWKVWEEIEKPLIYTLVDAELQGVCVRLDELESQLEENENLFNSLKEDIISTVTECIEAEKLKGNILKFASKKGEIFNPTAAPQIAKLLGFLGIKTKNTSAEQLLTAYTESGNEILKRIIDLKKLQGVISKFLKAWSTKHIYYKTKKIYCNFNSCGTETGRLCVDKATLVNTIHEGLECKKRICDLKIGDLVLTDNLTYQKVEDVIYKGKEQMYRITDSLGNKIICTKGHYLLSNGIWTQVKDLQIGSQVYTVTEMSEEFILSCRD